MTTSGTLQSSLIEHLSQSVFCAVPEGQQGEVACSTPLTYPNGDHVQVWVEEQIEQLEVSDLGIGSLEFLHHPPQDAKALNETASRVCYRFGVSFVAQRVVVSSDPASLAEDVWRVALASGEVAALAAHYQPRRRRRAKDFVGVVERDLRQLHVDVEREHELRGLSGHPHHATLYLPATDAVIEPISAQGHWNQVSTVYAKFGDLGQANGYRLFSVVDDRSGPLATDLTNLLVQVSKVVRWSARQDWLTRLV